MCVLVLAVVAAFTVAVVAAIVSISIGRTYRRMDEERSTLLANQLRQEFNRRIGVYAHQHFNVDGQPLDAAKYPAYLESVLPRPEDVARVHDIEKEPNWIEPKKADSLQQ